MMLSEEDLAIKLVYDPNADGRRHPNAVRQGLRDFLADVSPLAGLDHPNIVKFKGIGLVLSATDKNAPPSSPTAPKSPDSLPQGKVQGDQERG